MPTPIVLTLSFGIIITIIALAILITILNNKIRAQKSFMELHALTQELNAKLNAQLTSLMALINERGRAGEEMRESITRFMLEQQKEQHKQRAQFDEHQIKNLKLLIDSLQSGMGAIREQIIAFLKNNTDGLNKQLDNLTQKTNNQLKEISGQVEKRLSDGFEKTTATFTDVIKRLALIDEAQKKITELSSNVVTLQEILTDKRSRGAFGEVQLEALIKNVLPHENYKFQYTLSNGSRVDCILFLPEPTGNISIDSKFPLESYQRLSDYNNREEDRLEAEKQFRLDIQHHIKNIAAKYILTNENETADGAIMFIPAEAVFAEIHARYPELVELSHRSKVWMASPTTMMAILTTARAVLKDAKTRKQVHIIQKHLADLGKDFERFQERMDKLAQHIKQANDEAEKVHTSSRKITGRFDKIEKVDLVALEKVGE